MSFRPGSSGKGSRTSPASSHHESMTKTIQSFIDSIDAPFYKTGFVRACPSFIVPVTEKDEVRVTPPYSDECMTSLYEFAMQSQVGTKESTLLRLDARRSKEFSNVIVNEDASWPLENVCDEIRASIAPGAPRIRAELYKLLVYRRGDFFHHHQDAQQASHMFGSLLFFLPVQYDGGIFQVSKLETLWDNESMVDVEDRKDPNGCSWVAFFTDVIHKVTDVRSGFRVVLNYTLHFEESMCPSTRLASFPQSAVQTMQDCFQRAQTDFVIPLFYSYTQSSLSPAFLKGRDAHLFNAMHALGLEVTLKFVLRVEETEVIPGAWHSEDDEPEESDWFKSFKGKVVLVDDGLVKKSFAIDATLQQMKDEARSERGGVSWDEFFDTKESTRRALVDDIMAAQKGKPKLTWIRLKSFRGKDLHGRTVWDVGSQHTTQWLGNMTPPVEFFYMEAAMIARKR